MEQTPAHHAHNPDLLAAIPLDAKTVLECGCSYGALARELKKRQPSPQVIGVDIEDTFLPHAAQHCDEVLCRDIEACDTVFFRAHNHVDTWVFGDALEHLRDPWRTLRMVRSVIPSNGQVVACVPNAQHWSVQARLASGQFRYEDSGLMDKTHLRWFTRQTVCELFASTGFTVEVIHPRTFHEPQREVFVGIIGDLAEAAGMDPEVAMADALPLQYVLRARPTS